MRGAAEGIAKTINDGDWYNLRKLGQNVQQGRDAAVMEETQRYVQEQIDAQNPKPSKRTGGGGGFYGGGGGGAKRKPFDARGGMIRVDETEEVANHQEITARIKREYDRRIIDLDEYVKKSKDELETHYAIQSQDIDREISLTNKTVKDRAQDGP